jgi:hypothetical protein
MQKAKLWAVFLLFGKREELFLANNRKIYGVSLDSKTRSCDSQKAAFLRNSAGFSGFPFTFPLAFSQAASGKPKFFPVSKYYSTSFRILQAKIRIFSQFYLNFRFLCIFYYVNQCIKPARRYVNSTKYGMHK